MKLSMVGFVLRRAGDSLRQFLWSHALTAGVMALALFVVGAFLLVELNLQNLLRGWGEQIQITAYLGKKLAPADELALVKRVQSMAEVERVRHITREDAWRDFRVALGAQAALLEGLPREVLPASMEISLRPEHRDGRTVETLATRLRQEAGVAGVEYPSEWVERLSLVVLAVGWLKWLFAAVFSLATFFVVGSTIKLAALARKDEIEIMQLVGATEELIQAPFVIEGMIQGTVGAAVALTALAGVFVLIEREMTSFAVLWAPLSAPQFLDPRAMIILAAGGLFLGAAGSLIALRRLVRTWRAV